MIQKYVGKTQSMIAIKCSKLNVTHYHNHPTSRAAWQINDRTARRSTEQLARLARSSPSRRRFSRPHSALAVASSPPRRNTPRLKIQIHRDDTTQRSLARLAPPSAPLASRLFSSLRWTSHRDLAVAVSRSTGTSDRSSGMVAPESAHLRRFISSIFTPVPSDHTLRILSAAPRYARR